MTLTSPPAAADRPGRGPGPPRSASPGQLRVERAAVYVGTGTTAVLLGDVEPPGKRRMPAVDWARGLHADAAITLGLG